MVGAGIGGGGRCEWTRARSPWVTYAGRHANWMVGVEQEGADQSGAGLVRMAGPELSGWLWVKTDQGRADQTTGPGLFDQQRGRRA